MSALKKQSPEWQQVKLGEVCRLIGGMQPPKHTFKYKAQAGYVRLVQIQDFRRDDLQVYIPEDEAKRRFDVSDVMIGRYGPPVFQILRGLSGAYNVALMKAVPDHDRLDNNYLYYLLQAPEIQDAVIAQSQRAAGQTGVQKDFVEKLPILLPPLPEQRRIAAILNGQMAAVEKARTAAEARLEAIKELPAGYIRFSYEKGGRTSRRLADCLVQVANGVGQTWADYPVLGATRAGLAPAKEGVGKAPERYKLVDEGTVFYNPMRILLGSVAMVDEGDEPGITSPDYVVFKGIHGMVHSRWFYYWMRSPYGQSFIKSMSRGAVRERMLFNRLAVGEVQLPSWQAQQEAADKLRHIRDLQSLIEQELEAINSLPPLLLSRALLGKL